MFLTSCATTAPPLRGPEQGGPQWTQARSEHFLLSSTQGEDAARATLEELEQTQAVFEQVAFPSREKPAGLTEVVLLPEADYDAIVPPEMRAFIGLFQVAGQSPMSRPRLLIRGDLGRAAHGLLQHELTHRFVSFHCPSAPSWLQEGLAEFWETLEIKGSTAYFGGALRANLTPPPFETLLELDREHFYGGDATDVSANYFGAAALARVLYFQHRGVLTNYLNLLKSGQVSTAVAWGQATGGRLAEIRGNYQHFFHENAIQGEIAAPQVTVSVETSLLSPSEVHVLWAGLVPWRPQNAGDIWRELGAAIELAPWSPDAFVLRGSANYEFGDADAARQDIETALQLAPFRSQVLTGALDFSLRSGQRVHVPNAELARRLARFQLNARQLEVLARYHGSTGTLDQGIRLAARAVQLDSSCLPCYVTGSELLASRGDWQEAVLARRTAIALAGDSVAESELERLRALEAELARQSRSQ